MPPRPAKNCSTTRRSSWLTETSGRLSWLLASRRTLPTDKCSLADGNLHACVGVRRGEAVVLLDFRLDGTAVRQGRSATVLHHPNLSGGSTQKTNEVDIPHCHRISIVKRFPFMKAICPFTIVESYRTIPFPSISYPQAIGIPNPTQLLYTQSIAPNPEMQIKQTGK